MVLFDTPGQSEISFSSMAESSFISSSTGNHFGIFGRFDVGFAVFFLDFMWQEITHNIRISHGHGYGAIGRWHQLGLSEGLDEIESGVGGELAEYKAFGRDLDEGEFGDDVIDDF